MICITLLFIAMATLSGAILVGKFSETCQKIATSISAASEVYNFGSLSCISIVFRDRIQAKMFIAASVNYLEDISHWAGSNTQVAACSFEPGTPEDVGIAVSMLH